ncbi:MAG: hypothetical protein H7177_05030 [Rhizobacter sp.]|nr:hypothetical protein [Bacteriovorax sp.]
MKALLFGFVIFSFIAASAMSSDRKPNVCKEDAFKFCPKFSSLHDLPKCLRAHVKELGPECMAAIEKSSKDGIEKYNSCKADLGKYCQSAPKKLACLQENFAKLTPTCQSKIKK